MLVFRILCRITQSSDAHRTESVTAMDREQTMMRKFWRRSKEGQQDVLKAWQSKQYLERLRVLGLTTLKRRRTRGDLLETYKILSGKENVNSETFFRLSDSGRYLRGHSLKLYKRHCRLDIRKFFFSQIVVNNWNSLQEYIVNASSVYSFKKRLDNYYEGMGLL